MKAIWRLRIRFSLITIGWSFLLRSEEASQAPQWIMQPAEDYVQVGPRPDPRVCKRQGTLKRIKTRFLLIWGSDFQGPRAYEWVWCHLKTRSETMKCIPLHTSLGPCTLLHALCRLAYPSSWSLKDTGLLPAPKVLSSESVVAALHELTSLS